MIDITYNKIEAPKNLVLLLVNCQLKDYSPICAFVYYSENLDNQTRIILIKSMIEVLNNYIKLFTARKLIWNNKNVAITTNLMRNWKLEVFLDNFIKGNTN